jgi:hypothetical protein
VQIDGCEHWWFEDRGPQCTLLVFIDDATGRLMHLQFVESESTFAYFHAARAYLEAWGKPVAFYSDKHGVFRVNHPGALGGDGMTQFGRALHALNIDIICANSSQAKGRVERAHKTLQDRLVKEMRLAGISSITAGNEFLPGFMERFNARFAVTPASSADLHCRLNVSAERLRDILCHRVLRRTDAQLTLSYERKRIMLVRNETTEALAGQCLDIYHFADGQVDVRWKGLSLPYRVFDKEQRVNQAEIVENKRLGAALAFVKAMQDAPRPPVRVKSASEASGYTPRARKARRRCTSRSLIATQPNVRLRLAMEGGGQFYVAQRGHSNLARTSQRVTSHVMSKKARD